MCEVRSPGQLIEMISPMLGFPPVESVVVMPFRAGRLELVMRADLDELDDAGAVERLAELALRAGGDGAVVVFVSRDSALCPICVERFVEMGEEIGAQLAVKGVRLVGSYVVDELAAGARWRCLDCDVERGVLDDPLASPVAAAAVVSGRRMYRDRMELVASLRPDESRVRAVAPLLEGRVVVSVDDAVRGAINAAMRVAAGERLSDEDVAEVGAALVDVRVRDALIAKIGAEVPAGAVALWAELVRMLPSPWRVEALVQLGVAAYFQGEGPMAGVALDAALGEAPDHRMARILAGALQAGIHPEQLRAAAGGAATGEGRTHDAGPLAPGGQLPERC